MALLDTLVRFVAQQGDAVGAIDALVVFAVSLVVGGFGIYVGGRAVSGVDDYTHALITAVVGAVVWVVVGFLFGWIPFLGPLLTLAAYVWVINSRYPGGWVNAALIAVVTWFAALVVLYLLAAFDLTQFDAVGVPGI